MPFIVVCREKLLKNNVYEQHKNSENIPVAKILIPRPRISLVVVAIIHSYHAI
ncbi:hypothetical protein UYSO10_0849 [Kosakonia radicincitans]|nr:hypothetical protein UYSO10_0849 [Kosakonia radicincitans]